MDPCIGGLEAQPSPKLKDAKTMCAKVALEDLSHAWSHLFRHRQCPIQLG
jgi:hypothetical protein